MVYDKQKKNWSPKKEFYKVYSIKADVTRSVTLFRAILLIFV